MRSHGPGTLDRPGCFPLDLADLAIRAVGPTSYDLSMARTGQPVAAPPESDRYAFLVVTVMALFVTGLATMWPLGGVLGAVAAVATTWPLRGSAPQWLCACGLGIAAGALWFVYAIEQPWLVIAAAGLSGLGLCVLTVASLLALRSWRARRILGDGSAI